MSSAVINRLFSNLDMVNISNIKRRGLLSKSIIVYVNSALFFERHFYVLQIKNVKYETEGMLKQAWNYIEKEKYRQAEELFDKILSVSDKSYRTYFGKFVVCLLQNKDAYDYLKRTIETKNDTLYDDYYRLYLALYSEFSDIEEDYIPLIELLSSPKKIVAFNKNSYNGRYLEFLNSLSSKEYENAKKALNKCLEMKQDIYLKILALLLDNVIKHQKELQKAYEKQERELEKKRSLAFATSVKEKDLVGAKKALENILSYRNQDNQNNYIYYLFLELIETIQMVEADITYEIMPVDYTYNNETDYFFTFHEAIAIGDFETALKVGKNCRGKVLDSKQSLIKVNLYVILLEILYERLEERAKNIDNLYQLLISNIEQGNYKHALNLYTENSEALKEYNNRLVNYLFHRLIDKSTLELVSDQEEPKVEQNTLVDDTGYEEVQVADEVVEETILENKEETSNNEVPNTNKSIIITRPINNNVVIFLRHNEPNNEFFQRYQICLVNKNYEEAKIWLDRFAEVLEANNIKKRLDYYYYQIRLGVLETSYNEENLHERKHSYFLAYNNILEGKYEEAEKHLKYYIDSDPDSDIRGYLLLGRLYTLMKKNDKAIECYITANSMAPSPDAFYFLGEIYFKMQKWQEAVFCYLTYNEFYPKENTTVYLNLSECYKRLGKSDKVVKYLKIADEINIEQSRGLYLKDRILKAEMLDRRRREHFLLNKGNNSNFTTSES